MLETSLVGHVRRLRTVGQVHEALDLVDRLLEQHPLLGEAWLEKADICAMRLQHEAARESYQRALNYLSGTDDKQRAKAMRWVGITTRRLGNSRESVNWIERSLELADHREAHHHLALSYFVMTDAAKALRHNVDAILRQEDCPADYMLLSSILSGLGDWQNNAWILQRCLEKAAFNSPTEQAQVCLQLGASYQQLGRSKDALACFRNAAELDPRSFGQSEQIGEECRKFILQAEKNLHVFESSGTLGVALDAIPAQLRRIEAIGARPWIQARNNQQRFQWPLGHEDEIRLEMSELRRIWRKDSQDARLANLVNPYQCLSLPMFSAQDCKWVARAFAQQTRATFKRCYRHDPIDFDECEKLHVGLYTADLRVHPMLSLLRAFLRHYDGDRLRVSVFHNSADPSVLQEVQPLVAETVDITTVPDEKVAMEIHKRKVQVLLDCTGRTGEGRPGIVAQCPAPVQVAWGGFPGTSGDPSVHYVVADEFTLPVGLADTMTEKVLYIPGTWLINDHPGTYAQIMTAMRDEAERRERRSSLGLPLEEIVFANLGRLWKLDDVTLDAWCDIVSRVPGSVLWLLSFGENGGAVSSAVNNVRKHWTQRCGMPSEQLIFTTPFPIGEHLLAAACADICLDTPNYNGGATTVDMTFAGVPVVSTAGNQQKFMQRAGGSVLHAAGLPELAVADLEEYVELAVRLGSDADFRQAIRGRIRTATAGTSDSLLFNPKKSVEYVTRGLEQAYANWKKGISPRHIFTSAIGSWPLES